MTDPCRLAIVSTHPIQYNAPWFARLAARKDTEVRVFYTWSQRRHDLMDRRFGKEIRWDLPLLDGYEYQFVENRAKDPGNHHFGGIRCPGLVPLIREWQPTHLMVIGWNFRAHLRAMRYFSGRIPVLFRGDSTLLDESKGWRKGVRRLFLRYVYRFVDAALYVGRSNREYFEIHGLRENQLFYAPHAVDNPRFAEPGGTFREEARKLREQLRIPRGSRVILFAGKFEHRKNLPLLLDAFGKLVEEPPETLAPPFLVLTGSGELEEVLRDRAEGNPQVRFLPFQNQGRMPVIYRAGDVFCLPSCSETWGLAVNEAMACGLPCVISDRAGCAADLGPLPGNTVFRSGDPDSLTRALRTALGRDHPRNQQEFLSRWNFETLVNGVLEAMETTRRSSER